MRLLHDELCTYHKKCIGVRCVRFCRTWYTRAWGMRSCRDSGLALGMSCRSVDNSGIRSHARQSHNNRKPCTRSLALTFHYHFSLWSAAFPDPADSLPAAFRDPAVGLRCSGLFETPLIDSRDRLIRGDAFCFKHFVFCLKRGTFSVHLSWLLPFQKHIANKAAVGSWLNRALKR